MIRVGLNPHRALPRLVSLVVLLSTLTACGVSFHETFDGTETFKSISLAGDRSVGSELTLTVTVAQIYPVPVVIACFYEDSDHLTDDDNRVAFQERAKRIGETVLPPATLPIERQLLTFDFSVAEPGRYFLVCMTPAAADNGMYLLFTIRDAMPATSGR
jgi:hypothetical protein